VSFPFNVYLLAIASGFLVALLSLPLWRHWCVRTGVVDDPGHRKIHHEPIPLAGGLAVMTGLCVPLLGAIALACWNSIATPVDPNTAAWMRYGFHRRILELLGVFGGAFGMLILGWLDDKHELSPARKFVGQLLIALLVAASGVRITLFVHSLFFSYAITALWILTIVNALNFMDNMNGLCAGLGAIAAWNFAIIASAEGQYLVALIAFLACGSLLGFLPHNFPRAKAFLGDSGSHLTGYLLAVLAILPHFHTPQNPHPLAVLKPLLVLGVPLADLVQVVIYRWRIGQPVYVGDTNHLSHRLTRAGLSRPRAVALLWFVGALLGGLACLL
jgi:UDP-GlcNAc:undecaprenyl-phosphate GlcNAc-1-phosphate transferase